ncbi:hypothetical protein D3C85_354360 [compost metagenome]
MMKELDFDELDQAVNSLMTGIPKSPAPQDDKQAEKTLTITPTLSDSEHPSFSALEQAAAKAGSAIEATEAAASTPGRTANPLAARRSSGRFMDVVHPSSDMKVATRPTVSREGLQLNPVGPRPGAVETAQPSYQPAPVIETPAAVSETYEQSQPIDSVELTTNSSWPDPIDMAAANAPMSIPDSPVAPVDSIEAPTAEPVSVFTPSDSDTTRDEPPVADEEPAPLQTPFLSDTKVEKRPLGAFAVDQPSLADESQPADEQLAADPVDTLSQTAADLPDELQHDLIKIESDNSVSQESIATPDVASMPQATPAPVSPAFTAPVVTPAPAVPAGPASIQPQYKEEPSSTKEEHAAIYDTDSYHQPLVHPVKKKSGWLWVVWIVLLLALGAGGAAALYYFKII